MIPLFRRLIRALLWDELAAVRWIRGGLLAASVAVLQLPAPTGWERGRFVLVLVLAAGAGMVTAGQKNPPAGGST